RRRPGGGVRGARREPRHTKPHPGRQEQPAAQRLAHRSERRHAAARGGAMRTRERSLSALVTRGIVSYDEALARSMYPKEVARPSGVTGSLHATVYTPTRPDLDVKEP